MLDKGNKLQLMEIVLIIADYYTNLSIQLSNFPNTRSDHQFIAAKQRLILQQFCCSSQKQQQFLQFLHQIGIVTDIEQNIGFIMKAKQTLLLALPL